MSAGMYQCSSCRCCWWGSVSVTIGLPDPACCALVTRYHLNARLVVTSSSTMVLLTCVSLGSLILRTSRGHCGVTPNEADCAAGSMGAWTETSTTGCIQRCLECARCHFVSFSAELQDCSWYNKCSHLEGADGTHETVQVCPSTLPCPGPNPILGRCPAREPGTVQVQRSASFRASK